MGEYILAHDLGTSGNKATLYDFEGRLKGSMVCSYDTHFKEEGWAEQDPEDWWRAVCTSAKGLMETTGVSKEEIACVSFSGQMMGCLLIDGKGKPLRPMIIWADTRAREQERKMVEAVGEERGYKITGHRLSASYSAAKLLWVRDQEPAVYSRAAKMLNAKDYMIYRLTGEIVTDYSDASGTNLLDITQKKWSDELLECFGIERNLLPELYPSSKIVGIITEEAARETGLTAGTPVVAGGGDGSCACVGAGVAAEGKTYCVLGSSSWISAAAAKPFFDEARRTFNWVHLDPELYTPCGTMQAAGLSYKWIRDVMCGEERKEAKFMGIDTYELLGHLAALSPPGAGGLLYLPYLLGERSPRWNSDARGCFVGLGMSTEKKDMIRAVLEGVGYNLKVILDILENRERVDSVILIGGGAKGREWLQILADIWQKTISVPAYLVEATSMGAAVCGGVGIGAFPDFRVVERFNRIVDEIRPDKKNTMVYERMYGAFNEAYDALCSVFPSISVK